MYMFWWISSQIHQHKESLIRYTMYALPLLMDWTFNRCSCELVFLKTYMKNWIYGFGLFNDAQVKHNNLLHKNMRYKCIGCRNWDNFLYQKINKYMKLFHWNHYSFKIDLVLLGIEMLASVDHQIASIHKMIFDNLLPRCKFSIGL